MEPAEFTHPLAQLDVGTTTGHVGRHRDGPETARFRNDFRFMLMVLGVQDTVRNAFPFEHAAENFGIVHRGCPEQNRAPGGVNRFDFLDHGIVFFAAALEDRIVLVLTDTGPVGRNHDHVELVNLVKLVGFGFGGTGHPGQFFIHSEIVLNGDRGQSLRFIFNSHAFLGFKGLMQTVAETAPGHDTAGVLVHDHHFAFLNHVMNVALEQAIGAEKLRQVVKPFAFL